MSTPSWTFRTLVIAGQLDGAKLKVEVVLVGTGLLAVPSREQAVDIAAKIRALGAGRP